MANSILTGGALTQVFLTLLDTEIEKRRGVASNPHAIYTDYFQGRGARKGDTVMLPKPVSFTLYPNGPPAIMPIFQQYQVDLTEDADVSVRLDDRALTLSLRDFSQLYLEPMAHHLALELDDLWPPGATLVTADPEDVKGVQWCAHYSYPQAGLCVRGVGWHEARSRETHIRFDMLFGFTVEAANADVFPAELFVPVYQVTAAEADMLDLLLEAKAELVARRELLRWVA